MNEIIKSALFIVTLGLFATIVAMQSHTNVLPLADAGSQYTAFNVPDEFVQLTENRPATLEEFKSSSEYLPFMINNLGYACCMYFFDTGQFWCSIARYGSYTNNLFYLFAACFWCTEIYARCPGIQRSGI